MVKVPFLLMFSVACLTLVSGCVGDDAAGGTDGVITAQPTVSDQDTTTMTSDSGANSDADGEEGSAPATTPDRLPEPEWADTEFTLQPIAGTDRGLALAVRPGDDDLWIAERDGSVRVIQAPAAAGEDPGKPAGTVVLDISDKVGTGGEGGLLGLDFSPAGDVLHLSYTDTSGDSVIAGYEMDAGVPLEDTERIILQVEQPFSNHNGGQITLGPDGFLYVALGDGGSGGDPQGNGQDTSTLLGSILRIDPAGGTADAPYAIPAGNPFVDQAGARGEIWLYGVRNPWRFSFDAETGDLWIGDVGQNEIEEIDFLPASDGRPAGRGANLGWNIMEGDEPFSGEEPPPEGIGPIAWYRHDNGRCSVTGGYVYRGDRIPELAGVYLFGDYCTGEMFGIKRFPDGRSTQAPLAVDRDVGQIVSFGQGPDGELYVLESNGTLSRLEPPETTADQ